MQYGFCLTDKDQAMANVKLAFLVKFSQDAIFVTEKLGIFVFKVNLQLATACLTCEYICTDYRGVFAFCSKMTRGAVGPLSTMSALAQLPKYF